MSADVDIVVVGSGFAGSLIALIARKLGYRVALLERGTHPRFVIGESSTPLANVLLEDLARRYEIPELIPLTKWGAWQRTHPELACGLKRGFTFYHHRAGQAWHPEEARQNELLVAASPRDEIADTHWYRPDFDQFLVHVAQQAGVEFLDHCELDTLEFAAAADGGRVAGRRLGQRVQFRFRLLLDASGGPGFLGRFSDLGRVVFPGLVSTRTLYSHFTHVPRWDALHPDLGATPYPVDDAAVHHVFEHGWYWVLRFNNGRTSAGIVLREDTPGAAELSADAESWKRTVSRWPSIAEHLLAGTAVEPFRCSKPVAFQTERLSAGPCLLLPSAAGFVDPLFSTGFVLILLGLERLARGLESGGRGRGTRSPLSVPAIKDYSHHVQRDLAATGHLIAAAYRTFGDFASFQALSQLYFAAAIYSETARRLGTPERAPGFLLREHPHFGPAFARCTELAGRVPSSQLHNEIRAAVEPIDLGGLLDPRHRQRIPVDPAPALAHAERIGATREQMAAMLHRVGFGPVLAPETAE